MMFTQLDWPDWKKFSSTSIDNCKGGGGVSSISSKNTQKFKTPSSETCPLLVPNMCLDLSSVTFTYQVLL